MSLSQDEGKEIVDAAPFHDQSAVREQFTRAQFGLEQQRQDRAGVGQPDRRRRPRAIAQSQAPTVRQGHGQRSLAHDAPQGLFDKPSHHRGLQGRTSGRC